MFGASMPMFRSSETNTSALFGRSSPTFSWVDFFVTTVMRPERPFLATTSRAMSAISGMTSQVTTRSAPARAAIIATRPEPVPISSTRSPGFTARRRAWS